MVVSSSRTNLVSVSKTNLDFAQGKAAGTVDFIFFVGEGDQHLVSYFWVLSLVDFISQAL